MPEAKLAGRYRLDSLIARGGMATVWRATDEVLQRFVAAKILHPHLAEDEVFRERFRNEALAAAALTHPNIVSIFDTGVDDSTPFIVMEYLPGGTLKDLLTGTPTLEPDRVASIGSDICSALGFAHKAGIIHRDIKPANILFSETGHVKVGDFGIAKAALIDSDLTSTGNILGTIGYLAPELVEGFEPDARSDLYSLGIVLYECITGRAPFAGDTDLATGLARIHALPLSPRDIRSDIPKRVSKVVMKALAPAREERFQSADEMGLSLKTISSGSETGFRSGASEAPAIPSAEESFVKSEGRWLLPTTLIVILAAGLVLAVPRVRTSISHVLSPGSKDQPHSALAAVLSGGTYDPQDRSGEGENNSEVDLAFDHNISTSWSTQWYTSTKFGQLKDGVGIWVDLGDRKPIHQIEVETVSPGWFGAIRFSDDGQTWSVPDTPQLIDSKRFAFKISGEHRWWMVWITDLTHTTGKGDAARPYAVSIEEIKLSL